MNFRDKTVLCCDSGLYLHVARKLSESFGTVLLYVPWVGNGFPSSKQRQIGTGIEGIERVYSLFSAAQDADLVVFSDVYFADEQEELRSQGKPVWGSGYAQALEIERWKTKQLMAEMGMPVVPAELIIGIDALREYTDDKEDLYIKGSVTRGDFETFHHVNRQLTGPWLDWLAKRLGPRAKTMEFLVESPLKGVEVGYDGCSVDGKFGKTALYGFEDKDAGFIGTVTEFDELPDVIRTPTLIFGDAMRSLGCRGFYSNEIRIAEDGTPFLIDPCLRCGSPPSEGYIELFDNWDEVIWAGAHGEMLDLNPVGNYLAQIVLKSEWVTEEYLPVFFPDEIGKWVKLHNYCVMDGETTVVPQEFPQFGSVIGIGNTKEEAQKMALENAEQIQTIDLEWKHDVFDSLDKTLTEAKDVGIGF